MLSERLDWKRDVLGQFERIADLRTAVEITNSDTPEEFNIIDLGDTLAIRRTGNIQDLFTRRQAPKRFLSVETNLSTAKASIRIDDQGLVSDVLKQDRKFDEDLFTQKVNALVKEGLKSVISTEKKHQLNISLRVDGSLLIIILPAVPGMIFFLEHLSISDQLPMLEGLVAAYIGAVIGQKISLSVIGRTGDKLEAARSNPIYFEEFADIFNSPKHLANLRQGRGFLSKDTNKAVTLKTD